MKTCYLRIEKERREKNFIYAVGFAVKRSGHLKQPFKDYP